ncbi:MAG TPA: hypothetical protein VL738_05320 [Dactylosporangium sp.]|nr:hypothetical protein [Dactylosporangium sp.]
MHGTSGFGKSSLAAWLGQKPRVRASFPGGLRWVTIGEHTTGAQVEDYGATAARALTDVAERLAEEGPAGLDLDDPQQRGRAVPRRRTGPGSPAPNEGGTLRVWDPRSGTRVAVACAGGSGGLHGFELVSSPWRSPSGRRWCRT